MPTNGAIANLPPTRELRSQLGDAMREVELLRRLLKVPSEWSFTIGMTNVATMAPKRRADDEHKQGGTDNKKPGRSG